MNVDTGQMGTLAEILSNAKPGERVIPATIIPAPQKAAPVRYGPRKPLREVRAELQAAKASEA